MNSSKLPVIRVSSIVKVVQETCEIFINIGNGPYGPLKSDVHFMEWKLIFSGT